MKRLPALLAATAGLAIAAPALAAESAAGSMDAHPDMATYTTGTPVWVDETGEPRSAQYYDDYEYEEERRYPAERVYGYDTYPQAECTVRPARRDSNVEGAVIGGVVGGVIGNRVAGRGNRTLGTVLGAGAGAAVGAAVDAAEGGRELPYCEDIGYTGYHAGPYGGYPGYGYGYAANGYGAGCNCYPGNVQWTYMTVPVWIPVERRLVERDVVIEEEYVDYEEVHHGPAERVIVEKVEYRSVPDKRIPAKRVPDKRLKYRK